MCVTSLNSQRENLIKDKAEEKIFYLTKVTISNFLEVQKVEKFDNETLQAKKIFSSSNILSSTSSLLYTFEIYPLKLSVLNFWSSLWTVGLRLDREAIVFLFLILQSLCRDRKVAVCWYTNCADLSAFLLPFVKSSFLLFEFVYEACWESFEGMTNMRSMFLVISLLDRVIL